MSVPAASFCSRLPARPSPVLSPPFAPVPLLPPPQTSIPFSIHPSLTFVSKPLAIWHTNTHKKLLGGRGRKGKNTQTRDAQTASGERPLSLSLLLLSPSPRLPLVFPRLSIPAHYCGYCCCCCSSFVLSNGPWGQKKGRLDRAMQSPSPNRQRCPLPTCRLRRTPAQPPNPPQSTISLFFDSQSWWYGVTHKDMQMQ